MLRIKGFARKTRRLTKGGSLPASTSMRIFGDSILRGFSREKLPEAQRNEQSCGNGITPAAANGAKQHVRPDAERPQLTADSSVFISRNKNVSQFLHNAIVGSVSSERRDGADLGLAGDAQESPLASDHDARAFPCAELAGAMSVGIPRWKRILDVTCILLALPCWLPLMIVLMLWIRLASSGPIFYRQERVGYRRDRFMIFKFRTMHVNAETRTHEEYFAHLMRADYPMTKLDVVGDSRLIRCGRFLRASGLDELPQIFNVLRGEMSLVGPRPCLPHEFQRYETWHQQRVDAPAGLTGYWQVNGKNKTTFSEMIAMDLFYMKNMSVWLDLRIMLKTIPALIAQALESRRTSRVEPRQQAIASVPSAAESLNGSVKL